MHLELKDVLAIRLRALMDARPDLDTQSKLHKRTRLSQSTIQRILSGDVHTGLDVLAKLAQAFKVDPLSLIAPIKEGAATDSVAPSFDEQGLLEEWRRLEDVEKARVLAYMHVALASRTKVAHAVEAASLSDCG